MRTALTVLCLCLTGCGAFGVGRIKAGPVTVQGVKDAGKAASLSTSSAGAVIALPEGSRLVKTEYSALPATEKAPAQPAKIVTEIIPGGPTEYHETKATVQADTGTVDTSIAKKRIDSEESRPLLYGALACLAGAGFFIWAKYPTPAMCCGAGAVILFIAWKVSGVPDWLYVVGLIAAAAGVFLYFGHERGEKVKLPTP